MIVLVVRQVVDVAKLSAGPPASSSRAIDLMTSWVFRSREPAISMATGLADLIVGARGGDDAANRAGEAYVIYGKAGAEGTQFRKPPRKTGAERQVLDTTNLAPAAGFIIQGDVASDQLGGAVSGAGDVNGDGLDDLIVGANQGDDGGSNAGETYIVLWKKPARDGTQFGEGGDDFD